MVLPQAKHLSPLNDLDNRALEELKAWANESSYAIIRDVIRAGIAKETNMLLVSGEDRELKPIRFELLEGKYKGMNTILRLPSSAEKLLEKRKNDALKQKKKTK